MPRSREEIADALGFMVTYADAHGRLNCSEEDDALLREAAAALREGSNLDQLARLCEANSLRLEAWPAAFDGPHDGEWCVPAPRTDCLQLVYGASIEEAAGNAALTQLREPTGMSTGGEVYAFAVMQKLVAERDAARGKRDAARADADRLRDALKDIAYLGSDLFDDIDAIQRFARAALDADTT